MYNVLKFVALKFGVATYTPLVGIVKKLKKTFAKKRIPQKNDFGGGEENRQSRP